MIPALSSHRFEESWTWEMLDLNDNLLGKFDGVREGSISKNISNTIRTGGNLTWSGEVVPEWSAIRLRPTYRAKLTDGTSLEWRFGVFIPGAGKAKWRGKRATVPVELYDKLLVLDEDAVDSTFALPAGTVVVTAIRALIEGAGEEKHSIADSVATLVNALSWPIGTSKLRIINDLLNTINYFSLWCDEAGFYRGEAYVSPADRGVSWKFKDDEASIYAPDFEYQNDLFGVPNKVILVTQGSGEAESLVSVATNEDPDDPLSYFNRERWVTVTETGVEAVDQTALDGLAERRLESLSQKSTIVTIDHAIVQVDLNNLVSFDQSKAGISLKGVIQSMDIPCVSGGLVRTVIRKVA